MAVEFLAVTPSGQQPYWVPSHPPGFFPVICEQLLPFSSIEGVTLSKQQPYFDDLQATLDSSGTQLLPAAFFTVVPSLQHPYAVRKQYGPVAPAFV